MYGAEDAEAAEQNKAFERWNGAFQSLYKVLRSLGIDLVEGAAAECFRGSGGMYYIVERHAP